MASRKSNTATSPYSPGRTERHCRYRRRRLNINRRRRFRFRSSNVNREALSELYSDSKQLSPLYLELEETPWASEQG